MKEDECWLVSHLDPATGSLSHFPVGFLKADLDHFIGGAFIELGMPDGKVRLDLHELQVKHRKPDGSVSILSTVQVLAATTQALHQLVNHRRFFKARHPFWNS